MPWESEIVNALGNIRPEMTTKLNIDTTTQRTSILVRDQLLSHGANLLLLSKEP
jgi:hypothetical protein